MKFSHDLVNMDSEHCGQTQLFCREGHLLKGISHKRPEVRTLSWHKQPLIAVISIPIRFGSLQLQ